MKELIEILQERLEGHKDDKVQNTARKGYMVLRLKDLLDAEIHPIVKKYKERALRKNIQDAESWLEYDEENIAEIEADLAEINKEN